MRETVDSEKPLLRVDLSELDYLATPSYLKVKVDGEKEVVIELEWVYGVKHVIERNREIQKVKAGPIS